MHHSTSPRPSNLITRVVVSLSLTLILVGSPGGMPVGAQPQQLNLSCFGAWRTVFDRIIGRNASFTDVAVDQSGGAWIVGSDELFELERQPIILRWDGTALTDVIPLNFADPVARSGGGRLLSVAVGMPENAWAGGWVRPPNADQQALIMRWDGTAWSQIPLTGPLAGLYQVDDVTVLSDGSLAGVGYNSQGTVLIRFAQGVWSTTIIPAPVYLTDIAAVAPDEIWVVGSIGSATPVAYRYNGTTWNQVELPAREGELHGIAVSPNGNVWMSGRLSQFDPLVLRWDGGSVTQVQVPRPSSIGGIIHDIWPGVVAFADDNVWIAGIAALHWNGAEWRQIPLKDLPNTVLFLSGLAELPDGTLLGVADGQILHHQPSLALGSARLRAQGVDRIAAVPVTLSSTTPQTVTVRVQTVAQSALPGRDYTAVTATLTFPPCSTAPQTVEVPLLPGQPTRAFQVALSAPQGAALAQPATTTVATLATVNDLFLPAVSTRLPLPRLAYTRVFETDGVFNWDIYTAHVDGTDRRRLTNDPALDYDPDWSPDGSQILFTSQRDGNAKIYVINADGSGQRPINRDPANDYEPTWSPDGRHIAFSSDRAGQSRIFVMDADGRNVRQITFAAEPSQRNRRDTSPAWSPDGTRIAFSVEHSTGTGLFIINADGTNMRRLTQQMPQSASLAPAWSPDGAWIAFYGSSAPYLTGVCLIRPDGSGLRELNTNFNLGNYPIWAPDGRAVLVQFNDTLSLISLDGRSFEVIRNSQGLGFAPDLAPR